MLKKFTPIALALMATACVSVDGITTPVLDVMTGGSGSANMTRFTCDNGYKVLINRKSADHIIINFNNGKDVFVVPAYNKSPASQKPYYVADTNTVKWSENNGVAEFTYPDNNYRDTKKIHQTTCRTR